MEKEDVLTAEAARFQALLLEEVEERAPHDGHPRPQRLREAEGKFEVLFDGVDRGVYIVDLADETIVCANAAFHELTGYGPVEVNGFCVGKFHHGDELSCIIDLARQLDDWRGVEIATLGLRAKNGETFNVEARFSVVIDSGRRRLLALLGNAKDRERALWRQKEGDRRQRRQILALANMGRLALDAERGAKERVEKILEAAASALEANAAGAWLMAADNEGLRRMGFFKADAEAGLEWREMTRGDFSGFFAIFSEEGALAKPAAHASTQIAPACPGSGYAAAVSTLDAPITSGGELLGVVRFESAGLDRRWRLDEEFFASAAADAVAAAIKLERREEDDARLKRLSYIAERVGGAAHDLNNMLTVILTNMSLVAMSLEEDSALQRNVANAANATLRARDITRQFVVCAREEERREANLRLGEMAFGEATMALVGSGIALENEIDRDLWSVKADGGQIGRVLNNIVVNARHAVSGRDGAAIRLMAANVEVGDENKLALNPGRYARVSIADNGCGISAENIDRIFAPYFTTKQNGNGLGLSTSYSIVKKHGGVITVESEHGNGTTFHVYLPASGEAAEPAVEACEIIGEL